MMTERHVERLTIHRTQRMEVTGMLAARVGHDLNNLLTVISGFGECVIGELEPGSSIRNDMLEILGASERAKGLTSQLLAFSRGEPVRPQSIDINLHIDELRGMLEMLMGEEIQLIFLPGAPMPPVEMDPTALHRIITNLAVNGRDAMEAGGTLTITTLSTSLDEGFFRQRCIKGVPGEHLLMTVSDTGRGMDVETLERLFEPFDTATGGRKGGGLGLSTVSELIGQAGGCIFADSELHRGTSFSIYLPAEVNSKRTEGTVYAANVKRSEDAAPSDVPLDVELLRKGCPRWESTN